MQPQDLLYAKTHEWAHIAEADGKKIATVGISHFAVEALTDLVYLELPEVGRQVKAGESFGEIESVKAVSDLYSPVTGEVLDVNRALPDNLGRFQDDPYGEAWIAKIRVTDEASLQALLDYQAYQKQCAEEGH
ncbi:MAG: glycine cleavage system protein GcvH [Pirellulales bacterium]